MKYILYKTTNLINGYIYIGVHKTDDDITWDNYYGCGVYGNKPYTYQKSKTAFQKAVTEFGIKNFRRETLAIFDTAEEAYTAEGLIVNENFLARNDVYNMILGGKINNTSGKPVYKYSLDGEYLGEYKSCNEAALSVNGNSATLSHSIMLKFKYHNFYFSYIKHDRYNIEEANPKILKNVYRYTLDGNYDCEFKSLNDAGYNTFKSSHSYINKAATLGYLVKGTYYFSFFKENSYSEARKKQILSRMVFQYNNKGEFIKEYSSQKEAELQNKGSNISKSIKDRSLDKNNYYWSIEKVPLYNVPKKRSSKKVAKLDENNNILQTWESSNKCAKEVGVAVKNVLQGKYSYHKGYKYIYL